ncbi:EamA family transporter [Halomicroarcula sp. GCM10025324]|uniref:EamA family transporter n=1 Tax=Haloarcula TaxID=2237 RepID=UPI0023E8A774|nr:EamA family transporter [Halomicroarcula sp. ZS-22-S1]
MNVSVGVGVAVLAAVALAAQSLAVRRSTASHSVSDVVAGVFLVNLVVLVPLSVASYRPPYGLTPRSLAALAIGGLLGSLLARAALFVGIERLGASRAEALKSTFPLVAVVAAVVALGEGITPTVAAGVVLLVAGAAAVSWDARASPVTASGREVWTHVGFPLAAAVCLGVDPVFTKVGLAGETPALVGATVRVLAAACGFGLYLGWRRVRHDASWPSRPGRWTVVVGIANTTYLSAYLWALSREPVNVVAPILGASPLLVLLGSALFARDDEQLTARLGIAVAVLVAGVVLIVSG